MTDEAPEARLRAAGDWLGASCVPRWRDEGLLLAGAVEGDTLVVSGIGGKVEPDETFYSAMMREFLEETGCPLERVVAPPAPRHLTAEARREPVPADAAALVAERPPQHPTGGALWIAVFLGFLTKPPRPVEKVKHFIVVPPSELASDIADLTVDDLRIVDGDESRRASIVLTGAVTRLAAVHTGAAVLASPGLLAEWWTATEGMIHG